MKFSVSWISLIFIERGRGVFWHCNRENEPPKRRENQLMASHSNKKIVSKVWESWAKEQRLERHMGFRIGGGIQARSLPLFMCRATYEKCSVVAGGWRVLSKRYCSPSHWQAQNYIPHSLLSFLHPAPQIFKLFRNEWLKTQNSYSERFQNSCPEVFALRWKSQYHIFNVVEYP